MDIINYYQQNPSMLGWVAFIMYLVVFIDLRYVHPERCEKHGTNLATANRIIGCEECLRESFREYHAERRKQEDEELRRKARIFAEELKKSGVR